VSDLELLSRLLEGSDMRLGYWCALLDSGNLAASETPVAEYESRGGCNAIFGGLFMLRWVSWPKIIVEQKLLLPRNK
jgi:hypothetical protein